MIAVVGRLGEVRTLAIARRIARLGGRAEVVLTVPPGASGDGRLVDLAAAGVGHAAALRSPAAALDPADLQLALRYLPDIGVVVVAADAAALAPTATEAAAWAGARLIVVADDLDAAGEPGADAIVIGAPRTDPDEAFAGIVAALAVRLDGGEDAAPAWRAVERDLGLEGRGVRRAVDAPARSGPDPDPGPAPRR